VRRPERVGQSIREALAKGADRAIHIEEEMSGLDPLACARLLAAAVKSESPDLVLTGLQSEDLGLGQTGVILAELLGLPHATIIMEVEASDGAIRVKGELEEGCSSISRCLCRPCSPSNPASASCATPL